ncbi:hypothetical protein FRC10_004745 [Ceratobasidium sp. 414]|nr:hypothetical protein FRC10_004745 [Ceratobasidium sp. 414]
MLDPGALQLLGTLPRLESLVIRNLLVNDPEEPENEKWPYLELSAYSFPVLKRPNMRYLPSSVISRLFHSSALNNLMRDICKAGPHVVELSLDSQEEDAEIPPFALNCLQQLPLERLRFRNTAPGDFEPMVFALANVRYLDIYMVNLVFEDLILVAKHLTQLQYLSSDLVVYGWPSDLGPLSVIPSLSMLCLKSGFLFSQIIQENHLDENQTRGLSGYHGTQPSYLVAERY